MKQSSQKNKPESCRVGTEIHATRQRCFFNAFRAVTALSDYQNATYVEGIAVTTAGLILEHGWVERDGEIVDPTINDEHLVYFPGLRYQGAAGLSQAITKVPKQFESCEDLPIFYRFGFGGENCPEMTQAREQAKAYSKSIVEKSGS